MKAPSAAKECNRAFDVHICKCVPGYGIRHFYKVFNAHQHCIGYYRLLNELLEFTECKTMVVASTQNKGHRSLLIGAQIAQHNVDYGNMDI